MAAVMTIMFLLVRSHLGSPRQRAIKRLLLLCHDRQSWWLITAQRECSDWKDCCILYVWTLILPSKLGRKILHKYECMLYLWYRVVCDGDTGCNRGAVRIIYSLTIWFDSLGELSLRSVQQSLWLNGWKANIAVEIAVTKWSVQHCTNDCTNDCFVVSHAGCWCSGLSKWVRQKMQYFSFFCNAQQSLQQFTHDRCSEVTLDDPR